MIAHLAFAPHSPHRELQAVQERLQAERLQAIAVRAVGTARDSLASATGDAAATVGGANPIRDRPRKLVQASLLPLRPTLPCACPARKREPKPKPISDAPQAGRDRRPSDIVFGVNSAWSLVKVNAPSWEISGIDTKDQAVVLGAHAPHTSIANVSPLAAPEFVGGGTGRATASGATSPCAS